MSTQGTSWKRGRSEEANCNQRFYGAHISAEDRADHYCASYSFTRKTLRWCRKIFFWLLEVYMVHFFILYKKVTELQRLRHLAYRKTPSCHLLEKPETVMQKAR